MKIPDKCIKNYDLTLFHVKKITEETNAYAKDLFFPLLNYNMRIQSKFLRRGGMGSVNLVIDFLMKI